MISSAPSSSNGTGSGLPAASVEVSGSISDEEELPHVDEVDGEEADDQPIDPSSTPMSMSARQPACTEVSDDEERPTAKRLKFPTATPKPRSRKRSSGPALIARALNNIAESRGQQRNAAVQSCQEAVKKVATE